MFGLPFRQVHLDFHTSEHIDRIGGDFDPARFAATLARAHVDSVTCFARCHHGYIYCDTREFPERRHRHLCRNLLAEQIEACHKRGIRVPIYSTVQWDHFTAERHPEWLCRNADGSVQDERPGQPGFYRYLCVNTPYRDFLKAHLAELFDLLEVDGLFLDIVKPRPCVCDACVAGMKKQSLDPAQETDRAQWGRQVIHEFIRDMTAFIRNLDGRCSIFYNGGHVGPSIRDVVDCYTHLEVESLPSGGWGYLHFPLTVRYARTLTGRYLGMTGKFHTSWGDFHSFKNEAALQFECFTMLAHGARCSIGDQLHPRGALDAATYERIGSVYRAVEKKEPWCAGARPVTEIAVFSPEEFVGGRRPPAALGAVRILQEGGHQFDVIDTRADFSSYKVLVLPDVIAVSNDLARRIDRFVKEGGAVIASHRSGLPFLQSAGPAQGPKGRDDPPRQSSRPARIGEALKGRDKSAQGKRSAALGKAAPLIQALKGRDKKRADCPANPSPDPSCTSTPIPPNAFALDCLGVEYIGDAPFSPDFIVPQDPIANSLRETEHVMYLRGLEVKPARGARVLAHAVVPYFNRTHEHFCSHAHTPSSGRAGYPAVVQKGRAIYFAHPVFTQYHDNAPRWCKRLVLNALDLLLPEPLLRHDGPSSLVATICEQSRSKRWTVHLLHYIPERRGEAFDTIEEVIPLHNLTVSVRAPKRMRSARLVPQNRPLKVKRTEGRLAFRVPEVAGHQMIELASTAGTNGA